MPGTLLIGFRTASGGYTVVSAANPLPVTGGGGGGGGDASAANQLDMIAALGAPDDIAWAGTGDMTLAAGIRAIATTALSTAPTIVTDEAPSWIYIAAGSTDTAAGNANDLLDSILVIPVTKSPGLVSMEDGAGTNRTLFAGGTDSVSTLIPFPIDLRNVAAGTAWEITTGSDVAVIVFYRPRT